MHLLPTDPELDLPDLTLQKEEEGKAESSIFEAEEAFSNEVRVSSESDVRRKLTCVYWTQNPCEVFRLLQPTAAEMSQQPSLEVVMSTCDPLNGPRSQRLLFRLTFRTQLQLPPGLNWFVKLA